MIKSVPTIPFNISFNSWVDSLQSVIPTFFVPLPEGEENWREWVEQFILNNNLSKAPIPEPLGFPGKESWRDWACYFIQTI